MIADTVANEEEVQPAASTKNPVPYQGDTVVYVDGDGNEHSALVQLMHGGMTADLTVSLSGQAQSFAHVPSAYKLTVAQISSGMAHWKN